MYHEYYRQEQAPFIKKIFVIYRLPAPLEHLYPYCVCVCFSSDLMNHFAFNKQFETGSVSCNKGRFFLRLFLKDFLRPFKNINRLDAFYRK